MIVTILGDLAPESGLSGPVLTELIERFGLQSQAMRVALHRLKKDGWVESERTGRNSTYRFTRMARERTEAVLGRVYAPSLESVENWYVVIGRPSVAKSTGGDGFLEVLPRVYLHAGVPNTDATEQSLVAPIGVESLPDWLAPEVSRLAKVDEYKALSEMLEQISLEAELESMPVIERAALRLLVLHNWRRLVLRSNAYAEALLPPDAAPLACRTLVSQLLVRLGRPSLVEIEAALADG